MCLLVGGRSSLVKNQSERKPTDFKQVLFQEDVLGLQVSVEDPSETRMNKHEVTGLLLTLSGTTGSRSPFMHVVNTEQQLDEPINDLAFREAPPSLLQLLQLPVQVPVLTETRMDTFMVCDL